MPHDCCNIQFIEYKKLPNSTLEVTAELSVEQYKHFVDKALKKIASSVSVPGYRKGKMSNERVLSKFSRKIIENVKSEIVESIIRKAIDLTGLVSIKGCHVEVDFEKELLIDACDDLKAKVTYEYYPDFDYSIENLVELSKNFDFAKLEDVSDEEVSDMEKNTLRYLATTVSKNESADSGDIIVFDVFTEDATDKKSIAQDVKVLLDTNYININLYNALCGKNINDSVEVLLFFDENKRPIYSSNNDRASYSEQCCIFIKGIFAVCVPEISDELVVNELGAESVVDFREKLRKQLKDKKHIDFVCLNEKKLCDAWMKNCNIQIPNSWIKARFLEFEKNFAKVGKIINDKEKEVAYKEIEKTIAFNLLLKQIAEDNNIDLVEKDYMHYVNKSIIRGHISYKEATELLNKDGWKAIIHEATLLNKTSEFVVDKCCGAFV